MPTSERALGNAFSLSLPTAAFSVEFPIPKLGEGRFLPDFDRARGRAIADFLFSDGGSWPSFRGSPDLAGALSRGRATPVVLGAFEPAMPNEKLMQDIHLSFGWTVLWGSCIGVGNLGLKNYV